MMQSEILVQASTLTFGAVGTIPCALGPAGITTAKTEGDGATPAGVFALRRVLYRADRLAAPQTSLTTMAIRSDDGWCDDPDDQRYNRPVRLPYGARAETLFRDDHVYDICVILGHNDDPPVPGKGSAIFFHLARENYQPTEGCVAIRLDHMLAVLSACTPKTFMRIEG
ncbi:MAG: L,D-transpeptidase family protein [Pseudomonadota bacterium]